VSQPIAPPVTIHPVQGLPEVRPGDDLAALLLAALRAQGLAPASGDVLVIAQKVVSKAEGSRVALAELQPSPRALEWARAWDKDARLIELVLRESRRIVRMERGVIIAETHHGFVCANAGVDLSNAGAPEGGEEVAILLPEQPDRSAELLREALRAGTGADVAVIVADTFGRPWRVGLTQVALGVAGLAPLVDYRDSPDTDGRELHATVIAVADELACAADLVCGKTRRVPAAIVRGYQRRPDEGAAHAPGPSGGQALLRQPELDLFR
jgi:coenzyme F420-0:L-glutamate ligase / coenzyme F420-1:gamma-L-glutamate ligase